MFMEGYDPGSFTLLKKQILCVWEITFMHVSPGVNLKHFGAELFKYSSP